jgi:hypothetical protein
MAFFFRKKQRLLQSLTPSILHEFMVPPLCNGSLISSVVDIMCIDADSTLLERVGKWIEISLRE